MAAMGRRSAWGRCSVRTRVAAVLLSSAAALAATLAGGGLAAFTTPSLGAPKARVPRPHGAGADQRLPDGSLPASPAPSHPLRELLAAVLVAVLVATSVAPPAAQARDGTIAPPTCVSINNAAQNCPARRAQGATQNAEAQVRSAKEQLAKAEKEGGAEKGEKELVAFWEAEVKRLAMTKEYLKGIRSELLGGGQAASASEVAPSKPARWLSRLAIVAPDMAKEVAFWCEAVGMQKYLDLPDGGAVVAFGPPSLAEGDEGAYFGVEIRPSLPSSTTGSAGAIGTAKLSFVQVATPSLIRISKVTASGGELIDGYGYYNIRSPAGVDVRAYVDDRRDPVELVALAAPEGAALEEAARGLQALGLQAQGPYVKLSPETQSYMPDIVPGNTMYAGTVGGGSKQTVQVLLQPIPKPKQKGFLSSLPRGPALVLDENEKYNVDVLEQVEDPETTLSPVKAAGLTVVTSAGEAAKLGEGASGASNGFRVELRGAGAL